MKFIDKFVKDEDIKDNLIRLLYKCMKEAVNSTDKSPHTKEDGTIITKTDKKLDKLITNYLNLLNPSIPVISEEGKIDITNFKNNIFWLIDPIDGTSAYVRGERGYTVNIALIYKGSPILGFIGHPPTRTIWYAIDNKAFIEKNNSKKKLQVNNEFTNKIIVVMSKNFDEVTKNFVKKIKGAHLKYYSSSIKFCKLAEGKANFYPRFQSISKWDIAAGDAILRASGGYMLDKRGLNYNYNSLKIETGTFFAIASRILWARVKKLI